MKHAVFAAVLACLALLACDAALPQRLAGECLDASYTGSYKMFPSGFQAIGNTNPITTPTSTQVTFAKDFQITYFPTYKLVSNLKAGKNYALYQCGTAAPDPSVLPANATAFAIPLTSVSIEDSTALAFMNLLGLLGRISYVTQFAVDPCMQSLGLYGCKRITPGDANGYTNVDTNNVDGIIGYQTSAKTIAFNAAPDPGPLNRAEWIKYVAAFFNKEDVANTVFGDIQTRYTSIKAAVAAKATNPRPLVAWLYWQPAGFGDPDQVQLSFAVYKNNYTVDAGGRMLDLAAANATALKYGKWGVDVLYQYNSLVLTNFSIITQQLRDILADVDVLIEESRFWKTTQTIRNVDLTLSDMTNFYNFTAADIQSLKFLRNGKVLREDASSNPDGFTSWFEMGAARPDLVLQELAAVVTPSAVPANGNPTILRLLGSQKSTLLEAKLCPLVNCQVPSSVICPLIYKSCDGTVVDASATQRCAPTCPTGGNPVASPPAPPPSPTAAGMTTPLLMTVLLACVMALAFTRMV